MTTPADDLSDFVNNQAKTRKPRRRFTLIELLAFLGLVVVLIALVSPLHRGSRTVARRMRCSSNLRNIALALGQYESSYGSLPPAYTVDPMGKPLHSWRTLILPYLDQLSLYETINLSKPWNDPANAKVYATAIAQYHCTELNSPATNTTYLAVVSPGGCFRPDRARRLSEITDGHDSTLMVIEAAPNQAVHWMAPIDADESLVLGIGPDSKLSHAGGMNVAFLDGSVRFLHTRTTATTRRALISIAGNENLSQDEY